jgi:cysteine-rich repeat protein
MLRAVVAALALALFIWGGCLQDAAPECETPGTSQKCTCANGVGSRQVCTAFQTWGECYCDPQACGDGDMDTGEQCDDNNNDPGDGCSPDCQVEGTTSGGGNGSGASSSTQASASTGMGGSAQGGGVMGGAAGMGGAGGN